MKKKKMNLRDKEDRLHEKEERLHEKSEKAEKKDRKVHKQLARLHKKEDSTPHSSPKRKSVPLKSGPAKKKVEKVMKEFKSGKLHSGSKRGPEVTNRKQAIAIALSEARKASKKRKK